MELATAPGPSPLPLAAGLAAHGERTAIIDAAGEVTYRELDALVEDRATRLGRQRRLVLVEASNDRDPLVWYLAALRGGHPVLLAPAGASALVEAYDPDVVVRTDQAVCELVERRPASAHQLHPDLALLLSTSGSTGSPKLVRLSAAGVQANAEAIAGYLDLRPSDRAVTSLPMHYCYGLSVVHSHLARGAALVLTNHSVVDPCFWTTFRAAGATSFAGVPHTFELLDRAGFAAMSLPSLRYVTQAGGRLSPDHVRRFSALGERAGWRLFVMYGQTEATARMAYLPPELAATRPEAIGVPIPGGAFRIDPVEGAPDGVGELVYRGPNVMLGYAEGPADLAAGRTVHELRTGDLGRRTDDGLYEVTGRRSRFLKLFGLRVDLDRVEATLADHGVDALCTGDDRELVVAAPPGHGTEHVRRLVCRHVAIPAGSVRVLELDALPRLPNGKPDHAAVRAAAAAQVAPARAEAFGGSDVRAVFAEVLGRTDVAGTSTFVSLGGDSLSYVETSIALEEVLGWLPPGWHTTPVDELASMGTQRRRLKRVETNVVLRAVAILMVVGSHAQLFEQRGGAHVLLAIAGFNFARFQLSGEAARERAGRMVASAARVAVPAICWIGLLVAVTDDYSVPNIFLLNGHLGSMAFDERWRYWFIEVLVQTLLLLALTFSIPAVRRVERRHAFAFAAAAVGAGLAVRYGLVELFDARHRTVQPQTVFWVFALGWAAQRATSAPQRLLVSAVAVVSVRGFFFDEPVREAIVAAGILALVWLPHLAVVRPLDRLLAPVAGASLYIYLTHWHVFPGLLERSSPLVAVLGSVVVGLATWSVVPQLLQRLEGAGAALRRRRGDGATTAPRPALAEHGRAAA